MEDVCVDKQLPTVGHSSALPAVCVYLEMRLGASRYPSEVPAHSHNRAARGLTTREEHVRALAESFKEKVRKHVAGTVTMLLFGSRSFGVNLDFPYSVILSHVTCNGLIFEHTIFKVKI